MKPETKLILWILLYAIVMIWIARTRPFMEGQDIPWATICF